MLIIITKSSKKTALTPASPKGDIYGAHASLAMKIRNMSTKNTHLRKKCVRAFYALSSSSSL